MFYQIAYYQILGKPLIMYLGILALASLFSTATLGFLIYRGKPIPISIHYKMAATTIILALIHAFLGLGIYFFK